MRNVNRLIFVTGALMTASLAVIHCGGDDAAAPVGGAGTSSAGSSGAAGAAAGSGGSIASAGGAAGSSAGGGGAAGTASGAAGTAGAPAGDSGIKDATTTNEGGEAGACPASPPAENSACSKQQNCRYPAVECSCAKSKTVDGGRAWGCVDLGNEAGIADAEACPATIADGDACTTKGHHCPIGDAGQTCVCTHDVWNCP